MSLYLKNEELQLLKVSLVVNFELQIFYFERKKQIINEVEKSRYLNWELHNKLNQCIDYCNNTTELIKQQKIKIKQLEQEIADEMDGHYQSSNLNEFKKRKFIH